MHKHKNRGETKKCQEETKQDPTAQDQPQEEQQATAQATAQATQFPDTWTHATDTAEASEEDGVEASEE